MQQEQMKSMAECSVNVLTELWNRGFQQDYSDTKHTPAQQLQRMGRYRIDPGLSVVAYIGEEPAGFVWIGWREAHGRKLAWNGGTGVIPAFRGRGLSKRMLAEAIRRVGEAGAESLSLEAMTNNEPAVRAYRSCGFVTLDRLHVLQHKGGAFNHASFARERSFAYMTVRGKPELVGRLPFYNDKTTSWTCQWFSLEESQSLVVYDSGGNAAGYATFREDCADDGRQSSVELYHCEADPSREDGRELIRFMLAEVMKPSVQTLTRRARYIRASNPFVLEALTEAGFQQMKEEYLMVLTF